MDGDSCLPWIEKYRPKKLNDIVAHNEIRGVLKKFIDNKNLPHLLFYGPPGTGKTSCIMACAKELYGKKCSLMVLELNASDDRGIEVVRNRIKRFVISRSVFYNTENTSDTIFKLVILDETDAMTDDAQAILRQIMERYTQNARFCLICNFINRINPALRSRCTSFRFSPLTYEQTINRINYVKKKEKVNITDSAIETLVRWSDGDMRKILNILQASHMAYDHKITDSDINKCMGYPDSRHIKIIYKALTKSSYKDAYNTILGLISNDGLHLIDIIKEVHRIIINHIVGTDKKKYFKNFTDKQMCELLSSMKNIEYNQMIVNDSNIQLGALVGLLKID